MSRRKGINVAGWPVMKSQCSTCPFRTDGDPHLHATVVSRIVELSGSQICHHPALHNKPETHLCRGARDLQLKLLASMGLLSEPTDAAFTATSEKYLQRSKEKSR